MRSALLQTMLLALLAIPIVAAHDSRPWRGLKRALLWFVAFNLLYALALRFVYPRLS
jgi:hypothetical protein